MLADHRLLKLLLHVQQPDQFLAFHLLEGDPGPFGNDGHHLVLGDLDLLLLADVLPFLDVLVEGFPFTPLEVTEAGGILVLLRLDGRFLLEPDLLDGLFLFTEVRRPGRGLDTGPRPGFVNRVNRLVGQVAAGQVPVCQAGGRLDGSIRVFDVVMLLVFMADPLEDPDGVIHAGFVHLDRLEAPFQRRVLLDVLPVFIQRGGADALEFPPGQGGLDDVGGIHRALGGTGPHDGVDFIHKQNHIAGPLDLFHHGLDALLELAAILRAGNHESEIEGDDLLVEEDFGNDTAGDFLCQTLDDGGLTDAGLAD